MQKLTKKILKDAGIGPRQTERILYSQRTGRTWRQAIKHELGPRATKRVEQLMKQPPTFRKFVGGVSKVYRGNKKIGEIHQIRGTWNLAKWVNPFGVVFSDKKTGVVGYELAGATGRLSGIRKGVQQYQAVTLKEHRARLARALERARWEFTSGFGDR